MFTSGTLWSGWLFEIPLCKIIIYWIEKAKKYKEAKINEVEHSQQKVPSEVLEVVMWYTDIKESGKMTRVTTTSRTQQPDMIPGPFQGVCSAIGFMPLREMSADTVDNILLISELQQKFRKFFTFGEVFSLVYCNNLNKLMGYWKCISFSPIGTILQRIVETSESQDDHLHFASCPT